MPGSFVRSVSYCRCMSMTDRTTSPVPSSSTGPSIWCRVTNASSSVNGISMDCTTADLAAPTIFVHQVQADDLRHACDIDKDPDIEQTQSGELFEHPRIDHDAQACRDIKHEGDRRPLVHVLGDQQVIAHHVAAIHVAARIPNRTPCTDKPPLATWNTLTAMAQPVTQTATAIH